MINTKTLPIAMLAFCLPALWPLGAVAEQIKGFMPQDPETVAQVRAWNSECLQCHVGDSLHELGKGLFGLPEGRAAAIRLSPAYAASNHGRMACKSCHTGAFVKYPHKADPGMMSAKTLPCDECHAQEAFRVEDQIEKSVHSKNVKEAFSCSTCHDPHVVTSAKGLDSAEKIIAQDNGMCLDCHNSEKKFLAFGGKLVPDKKRPDIDKIHEWLPNTKRHWESARCVDCHTPPVSNKGTLSLSHEILDKKKARKDCSTCHAQDSALRAGLYRHIKETEGQKLGFANAVFLRSSYVIGATRNLYLDLLGLVLIGGTLAGVTLHGLLRILAARRRKS